MSALVLPRATLFSLALLGSVGCALATSGAGADDAGASGAGGGLSGASGQSGAGGAGGPSQGGNAGAGGSMGGASSGSGGATGGGGAGGGSGGATGGTGGAGGGEGGASAGAGSGGVAGSGGGAAGASGASAGGGIGGAATGGAGGAGAGGSGASGEAGSAGVSGAGTGGTGGAPTTCTVSNGALEGAVFDGHCYFIPAGVGTRQVGQSACVAAHAKAHLATIGNQAEKLSVDTLLAPGAQVWIGLERMTVSTQKDGWSWVTNAPYDPAVFHNWGTTQPNAGGLCVMLDTVILPTQPPGWNDRDCSEMHGVLCEIDFVP